MELINMNNAALGALQLGRPKQALDILSMALASLKDHFGKEGHQEVAQESTIPTHLTTPTPPTTTETPSPRRQHPRCASGSSIGAKPDCKENKRSLTVEEDEGSVVPPSIFSVAFGALSSHNDGLVLNYNKALMVLHSLNDLEVLTSVVLYNMATINHARAIERGSSTLLTNALKAYKMATDVIKIRDGIDRASDFVLLLSYHNMAHIYSSRFCPEEMRGCFDATRFLLTKESIQRFLDEDDRHFFSLSFMLKVEDISLAPAA